MLACDDIFLLPGVPQLFKLQLTTVLQRVSGTPLVLQNLYLSASESEIAKVLDGVALAAPQVMIGSYPTFDADAGYKVKITIEHADAAEVQAVAKRLLDVLPANIVLRRD